MISLAAEDVRLAALHTSQPIVLRGFIRDWELCSRSLDAWNSDFGDRTVSWRMARRARVADEPCWERACERRNLTFKAFLETDDREHWMYFDYKHLQECFSSDSEVFKTVTWANFGFPEKGGGDSTLWVGSRGAHTPAHQDTYGTNIVAQLYGTKRWILFPPEAGGLRPTRVPYEESSVYSELNFCCPRDLDPFRGVTGARCVELEAGDALLVPRGWWHHVQHLSAHAISLNLWLPHEADASSRVSEALVRLLVAQLCKDLPPETSTLLLNPNEILRVYVDGKQWFRTAEGWEDWRKIGEAYVQLWTQTRTVFCLEDDLADTPLTVLFLQLDTVLQTHLDEIRKLRRHKRQKTCQDDSPAAQPDHFDIDKFLLNKQVSLVPSINSNQLVDILKENIKTLVESKCDDEDDVDGTTSRLRLTKALINAYCQSTVVDVVKQNLLSALS